MKVVSTILFITLITSAYSQTPTPMEKPILGLRTASYRVSDLDSAKKWYAKVFDTSPYFDEPFYVGFNIEGYELGLMPEEKPVADKPESVIAWWGVKDAQKAFDRLISLGAISYEAPTDVGDGIITAAVKDPWDNILGIIYNPYFKKEDK